MSFAGAGGGPEGGIPGGGSNATPYSGTARLLRAVPVTSETSFTVPWLEEAATAVHLSETECRITLPEMARQAAAVVAPAGCMTVQIWLEMVALVAAVAGHLRAAQTESLATEDSAAAVVAAVMEPPLAMAARVKMAVAEVAFTHQKDCRQRRRWCRDSVLDRGILKMKHARIATNTAVDVRTESPEGFFYP